MGTTVAHCEVLMDENRNEAYFFVFNDLSCRWTGKYRLRFVITELIFPYIPFNSAIQKCMESTLVNYFQLSDHICIPG
jgi:hypothetical protein